MHLPYTGGKQLCTQTRLLTDYRRQQVSFLLTLHGVVFQDCLVVYFSMCGNIVLLFVKVRTVHDKPGCVFTRNRGTSSYMAIYHSIDDNFPRPSHVRGLWQTVGSDNLVIWWSINLLAHCIACSHSPHIFLHLPSSSVFMSVCTPLQPQRQWSDCHYSHTSSQSTAA